MRKAVIGLTLALAAATALAQEGKGYLAAGAGTSKYSIDFCDIAPSSCDDSDFAWNLRAGYHFFPWLGLEASFMDFGAGTLPGVLVNPPANSVPIPTDSDVRASGFVASVVGRVPLGPVSLLGRVGWGAITGKFRGNAAVRDLSTGAIQYFSAENRETSGQLVYGVGLSFDFSKSWSARVDWDRTSAEDGRNPEFDVEMFTVGVGYRF
jgi:opacity protein-like surface antigen